MIISLSRTITAQLRACSLRTLSTGSSPSDKATMSDALKMVRTMFPGQILPQEPPKMASVPAGAKPVINIYPAEDPLLHYFTSKFIRGGHRTRASRITSRMLLHIHTLTRAPPLQIFREAILTLSPAVRSMMHRKGSKTVAYPIALGEKRRTHFAVHWLLKACEKRTEARPEKTIEERLARELIAVIQGKSGLLKNKKDMHVFAMVNRCGICENIGFLYLTNMALAVGTHGIVYDVPIVVVPHQTTGVWIVLELSNLNFEKLSTSRRHQYRYIYCEWGAKESD
jgi:small subunit ribosomal protein S7